MTAASPQELVEHALKTTTSDQCVVIVHDSTSANLRWANNTLTTNGVMHDVSVTVGGDKRPGPFVPDKYGHKRQPQLGY